MNTTEVTGIIAAALVAGGVLFGGAAELAPTPTRYLADYGSNVTAEDSTEHAESEGVRHQGDRENAPGYFERMNGSGE